MTSPSPDARHSSSAAQQPFTITRVLEAPRELVWTVWTQREHLQHWFGPKGVTIEQCTLDLRPGGVFHYAMRNPGGGVMWGRWVFREVTAPERLVFVSSFADEKGQVIRPPFADDWPREILSVVTFAPHAGGGTTVTIEWSPLDPTPAERTTFADNHGSMRQGWTGTFEQLADYLAKRH